MFVPTGKLLVQKGETTNRETASLFMSVSMLSESLTAKDQNIGLVLECCSSIEHYEAHSEVVILADLPGRIRIGPDRWRGQGIPSPSVTGLARAIH